jgi:hypothetical protein
MAIEMGEQTCARCGMPRREWKEDGGQGYTKESQTYCCRGCAEDTGCTCR